MIVFVHIPKTAGTTVLTMLRDQFSPAEMYKINYTGSRKQIRRLHAALRRQRDTLRLVQGHMDFFSSRVTMPPGTRFFTLLRDPVERAISHYYHMREELVNPIHPLAMRSSLLQWVRDCGVDEMDNGQTRRLAGAMSLPIGEVSSKTLQQAKANLAGRIAVVGLTERFDESQILLQREFKWPLRRYPRRRVSSIRVQKVEVGAEVLKEIENCNRFDLELYQFAAELFEKNVSKIDMASELAALKSAPEYIEPSPAPVRPNLDHRGFLSRLKQLISPQGKN